MKRFLAASFFILAGSLINISTLAQSASDPGPFPSTGPTNGSYSRFVPPDLPDVSARRRQLPDMPREDRVLKVGLLAPSGSDRAAFAAFLRSRNTGLIRLLPREIYDSATYHPRKLLNISGGAYYSFFYLTHIYRYGSDIELEDNNLSVGFAGADYGMLTNLGDVSLEDISRDDQRLKFISSYEPPTFERQARAEGRRFRLPAGVTTSDGRFYRSRLPVQENSTYLLRSIVYDRSDVLVAFRVFRKDLDGSAIIAWKLLKKYAAPGLIPGK